MFHNEPDAKATIKVVYPDLGNRVYAVDTDKPIGRVGTLELCLVGNEDQKPFFYVQPNQAQTDCIVVNFHNCADMQPDTVYVWQPRLPGKPHACPRCKVRVDMTRQR